MCFPGVLSFSSFTNIPIPTQDKLVQCRAQVSQEISGRVFTTQVNKKQQLRSTSKERYSEAEGKLAEVSAGWWDGFRTALHTSKHLSDTELEPGCSRSRERRAAAPAAFEEHPLPQAQAARAVPAARIPPQPTSLRANTSLWTGRNSQKQSKRRQAGALQRLAVLVQEV